MQKPTGIGEILTCAEAQGVFEHQAKLQADSRRELWIAQNKANDQKKIEDAFQETRRKNYLQKHRIDSSKPHQLDLIFSESIGLITNLVHMPNDYARSSLFSASNHTQKRKNYFNELLFHYSEKIEIRFTGEELRARDDELIWLQVMKFGEKTPLGQSYEFALKDLVTACGWPRNKTYYEMTRSALLRLRASTIMLKNSAAYGESPTLNLLKDLVEINDGAGVTQYFRVAIDKNLILLYANSQFTQQYLIEYRKLSPVARRLADYIKSHKTPFPLSSERFMKMCGCNASIAGWRKTVIKACAQIVYYKVATRCELEKDSRNGDKIIIVR